MILLTEKVLDVEPVHAKAPSVTAQSPLEV